MTWESKAEKAWVKLILPALASAGWVEDLRDI
jgi:hypothetical protein